MYHLGIAVLYSVVGVEVPREQLVQWFIEENLDASVVPQPPRRADACATAVREVKATYPMPWRSTKVTAKISVQRVRPTDDTTVYAMVREVRDQRRGGGVSTDTVADVKFLKRRRGGSPGPGKDGTLHVRLLSERVHADERELLNGLVSGLRARYAELCGTTLTTNRVRGVVRDYITEQLHGVRLKPKGSGDYFILPAYTEQVNRLATVVNRLGGQSAMDLIELPDTTRHRRMVQRGIGLEIRQEIEELAHDARRRQPQYRPRLIESFRELMNRCTEYIDAGFDLPADVADTLAELYELLDSKEATDTTH